MPKKTEAKPVVQKIEKPGTLIVQEKPGALAPWQQEALEEAKADAAKFVLGTQRIQFSVHGPKIENELAEGGKLQVVIVEAIFGKAYYEKSFDQKNPTQTPVCYAFHPDDPNLMVPHTAAPDKQAEKCPGCKHNAFNTALQGNGKRCKDEIRLMCAVPSDDPEELVKGEFRSASIPPGSLKGWGQYVKSLRDNGASIRTVVTELSCEALGGGFRVLFRPVGSITEAQYRALATRRDTAREELQQAYPVLDVAGPAVPPKAGKRKYQ